MVGLLCRPPNSALPPALTSLPPALPRWHAPTPEEEVPRETGHLLEEILEEQHKQGAPAVVPLVGWQGGPTPGAPTQWALNPASCLPLPSLPCCRTVGQGGSTPAAAAPTQAGGAGAQGRAARAGGRQRVLSCRHTSASGPPNCFFSHFMHCITCGDIQKDCGGPCCCTGVRDIQCAEAEGAHTKGPGARVQKAGRGDC